MNSHRSGQNVANRNEVDILNQIIKEKDSYISKLEVEIGDMRKEIDL